MAKRKRGQPQERKAPPNQEQPQERKAPPNQDLVVAETEASSWWQKAFSVGTNKSAPLIPPRTATVSTVADIEHKRMEKLRFKPKSRDTTSVKQIHSVSQFGQTRRAKRGIPV